jgi:hypothetical protein
MCRNRDSRALHCAARHGMHDCGVCARTSTQLITLVVHSVDALLLAVACSAIDGQAYGGDAK